MNNKFISILTVIFFQICFLRPDLIAQAPSASITTWKGNAQSAYSIMHDDYSSWVLGIFQNAYPAANQRGIKLSFGAITSGCDNPEWTNARTMIQQGGHECVNHTHLHKCATCSAGNTACTTVDWACSGVQTYTTTDFAAELNQSDALIEQNTNVKARFFVHPYDHFTSEVISHLASLNYVGSRAGTQGQVNSPNYPDPYRLNFHVWGPDASNDKTVAQLNAAVDAGIAANGYVIREFHNVGAGSLTNPWGNITTTEYNSHLDYVKTKMDAKQVWSATTTEVITYKMQREVYQPALVYNAQTGLLTVNFTSDLTKLRGISSSLFTPSVFTTPITLKIDVTGIAGTLPTTATQNGKSISYTRSGNILLMDVYPHSGAVTLNVDVCGADTQKPVIANCPSNIILNTTGTTAVATWTTPTVTDNCAPTPTLVGSHTSGTAFPVGVTTVTYNATDAKGNTATPCTFTVTVNLVDPCATDNVKPVISNCPSNISLNTSSTTAVATWVFPTVTDNCTSTPILIGSHTSGTAFPVGVTTVTYNATDAKGNTATPCTFTVTVNFIDPCATDNVKPVISNCPSNIVLNTSGTSAIGTWTLPTVTDNCSPTPTLVGSHTSGTAFPVGVTTVTYNATDAKGNIATPCSFTVSVNFVDPCATDNVKPVIANCPSNITLNTSNTTAIATWTLPTVTDNCSPTPTLVGSHASGASFLVGTTVVSYNATDAKGNTAIPCAFMVTVNFVDPCATDNVKPVIANCPSNIILNTTGTTAVATWTTPTVTDNCAPTPTLVGSHTSGAAFPVGVTTVTYNATDAKGNTATPCTFTVTVNLVDPCATDNVKPVIANCPSNIILNTTGTTAVATWTLPTVTDNCAPTPTLVGSHTSGAAFPVGVTTVTYSATDAKGNVATPCTFTVTVNLVDPCATDNVKPVIANCPSNIILNTTGTTAVATWTLPTVTDNCAPTPTLVGSHTSGAAFPVGVTTVTYSATDAKGNVATPCTFTVTVNLVDPCATDNVKPVIANCPSNIILNTSSTTAVATWTAPTVTDNCSPTPTLVASHTSGTPFSVGTTTVTYSATDAKGNTATPCTFTVTVSFNPCTTDNIKPVISNCPSNISLNTTGTTAVGTWTVPTVTDNCTASPTVTSNFNSGAAFPVGTTTVTYNATDAKGNIATPCSFTVSVTGGTPLDACAALTVNGSNNSIALGNNSNLLQVQIFSSSWQLVYSTISLQSSLVVPNLSAGNYNVSLKIYRVSNGWTLLCSKSLVVNVTSGQSGGGVCDTDVTKPVFANCPANISLSTTSTTATATWTAPTVTDNCTAQPTVVSSHNSGFAFPVGTTSVVYNATDAKNNAAIPCTFNVTVTQQTTNNCANDTQKPVFTNCPANITVSATGTSTVATWIAPTATDNCTPVPTVTSTHNSGATFPTGSTTVSYNAIDSKGNTATPCSFVVTVNDAQPCGNIVVKNGGNSINITGLSNTASIQVFNAGWQTVYNKAITTSSVTIPNLAVGNYVVNIKLYRASFGWTLLCSQTFNVTVSTTASALNQNISEILTLAAQVDFDKVRLNWGTNLGDKTDYFTVQKLLEGKTGFQDISDINVENPISQLQYFTYDDMQPADGDNYYRIKQVLNDGVVKYSETVKVRFSQLNKITIYPNPADSKLNILLKDYTTQSDIKIYLYNSIGQPVKILTVNNDFNTVKEIDTATLPEGHYLVRLVTKGKKDYIKQVFISH